MFQWLLPQKASAYVRREQIYLLYNQGNTVQILGWCSAAVIVAVYKDVVNFTHLLVWFAALTLLTIIRVMSNISFKRSQPPIDVIEKWGLIYVFGTLFSGLVWGSLSFFFDTGWPVSHQVIFFTLYTSLIAGAFNSNSAYFIAFPAFYLPIALGLGIVIVQYEDEGYFALLVLMIIYLVHMYIASLKYNNHLARALHVRFENEELADRLITANEQLSDLADKDEMTQLFNRRSFDRILGVEWSRHFLSASPISLLFMDVDYFKQYNDTYGHEKGDQCLIEIASVLKMNAKRANDYAVRYGGEEFAMILPNTSLSDAKKIAEHIHRDLHELGLEHERSDICPYVTLSIGIATAIPKENEICRVLFQKADQALYRAKESGRNCTIIANFEAGESDGYIETGI